MDHCTLMSKMVWFKHIQNNPDGSAYHCIKAKVISILISLPAFEGIHWWKAVHRH